MPLLALVLVFLAVILAGIVLLPFSLLQRYRVGTSRQQARGWLITINLLGIALSSAMFLAGSAITSLWVPNAFAYSALGLLGGGLLGLLGLLLTRWEPTPRALHFTPNRLLVLAITLTITGRILYSFWRAWQTWSTAADRKEWLVTWGVAEALAAGGIVLGYYLAYWAGVRRRQKIHSRRSLRTM